MSKVIHRSYKYRLYPTKKQQELLSKFFGCTRFVYNYFLNKRIEKYKNTRKSSSYCEQAKELAKLKQEPEFTWLRETNSQALQQSLRHLESAYKRFFKSKKGFPKFKKKRGKNSFTIPQNIKIIDSKIFFPKFKEGIKFVKHTELKGRVLFITVSKTPTNKYFVSVTVEQEYNSKEATSKEIGIDMGIKHLVITSNGKKYKNPKYLNKYKKKLRIAQKHLSRKVKGSNRFEKQRLKVALIHEKIHNSRVDNLHKISHELVMSNDAIYTENLNITGMLKNHKLARTISDCGWHEFTRQLDYKGDWDNCYIHAIDRFYPSSKTCSNCGYKNEGLTLSTRQWTCPKCHKVLDRDVNASINILLEGKRELSVGTTEYISGENVRPNCACTRGQISAKL